MRRLRSLLFFTSTKPEVILRFCLLASSLLCRMIYADSMIPISTPSGVSSYFNILKTSGKVYAIDSHSSNGNNFYFYDNATKTWISRRNIPCAGDSAAGVVLKTGKLMVTGGNTPSNCTNLTQIYDPVSNTWTNGANMINPRINHAALLLDDGRVFVYGNFSGQLTAEIYDPKLNSWRQLANAPQSRRDPVLTLLQDGKIMVSGGWQCSGYNGFCKILIFDEKASSLGEWKILADIPSNMGYRYFGYSVVQLPDGRLLMTGGWGKNTPTGSIMSQNRSFFYNLQSQSWSEGPNLNMARQDHNSLVLKNGKVLVTSGNYASNGTSNIRQMETFDPATNRFDIPTSLQVSDTYAIGLSLSNGDILVSTPLDGQSPRFSLYTPSSGAYPDCSCNLNASANPTCLKSNGISTNTAGWKNWELSCYPECSCSLNATNYPFCVDKGDFQNTSSWVSNTGQCSSVTWCKVTFPETLTHDPNYYYNDVHYLTPTALASDRQFCLGLASPSKEICGCQGRSEAWRNYYNSKLTSSQGVTSYYMRGTYIIDTSFAPKTP